MYTPTTLLVLAAAVSVSALNLAERAAAPLEKRSTQQGWSLVSSSNVDGLLSCNNGYYCPSEGFVCNPAQNSVVSPCCATSGQSANNCIGEVTGAPVCADSAWSMYVGVDNNGFCCAPGQVGILDRQARKVSCVASGDVGSQSTAQLTMPGSGVATSAVSSASSSAVSSSSATSTSSTNTTATGTSSSSTATSSLINGAEKNGMAMGIVAAGLALVAAM